MIGCILFKGIAQLRMTQVGPVYNHILTVLVNLFRNSFAIKVLSMLDFNDFFNEKFKEHVVSLLRSFRKERVGKLLHFQKTHLG